MAWVEHEYANVEALVDAVAFQLERDCARALSRRGRATLALAGGKTPLPIYRRLAMADLAWEDVRLLPTDDRCVPHEHPACNLRELHAAFTVTRGVRVEALTPADGDADLALEFAERSLARFPDSFDIVVLGMGMDGHTASLFPGADGLADALKAESSRNACRIDPNPLPAEAPFARISLTLARLLRTRSIHLVITGRGKHDVLNAAQLDADVLRYPIGAILHAPGNLLNIHWSP